MNEPRAPFDDPEPEPYTVEYAYEDASLAPLAEDGVRRRRAGLLGVGAFAVFVLFGAVVWLSYGERPTADAGGEPPLVRADAAPVKVEPEQAGGAEAPNLDSEVHTALLGGDTPSEVVRVLPGPEPLRPPAETSGNAATDAWLAARDPITEMRLAPDPRVSEGAPEVLIGGDEVEPTPSAPVSRPVTAAPAGPPVVATPSTTPAPPEPQHEVELAALPQDAPATDLEPLADDSSVPEQPLAAKPAATMDRAPAVAVVPVAKPQRTAPVRRQAVTAAAPWQATAASGPARTTAVAATARPAPSPTGRFRVQLAALGDRTSAERGWVQLRQRHGDVLASYAPLFEQAQTDRGPIVRVQIGPFSDRASASAACEALKRRDAACFVVGG